MNIHPMSDSDGDFGEFNHVDSHSCRKCKAKEVRYRVWESHCGGYEDYHHKCFACGHTWWEDGIDS